MRKTKYLLFLLFVLTMCVVNVKAFGVKTGGINYLWGRRVPKKTSTDTNTDVFCSEFHNHTPTETSDCNSDTNWKTDSKDAFVIGKIITSGESYEAKEILINAYLAEKGYTYIKDGITRTGLGLSTDTNNYVFCNNNPYVCVRNSNWNTINEKLRKYESEVDTELIKISGKTNPKYNIVDGMFHVTVYLSGVGSKQYDVYFENNNFKCETYDGVANSFKFKCKYTGNENKEKLKFTVKSRNKNYTTSTRYYCGDNYQKVFKNETFTIEYEVSDEISIPTITDFCNNLISEDSSIANKLKIYNYFKLNNRDWRKILNFNNSSCDVFKTNYKKTRDCNNINIEVDDFNESNVSGYQETTTIGDKPAYCTVEFKYNNVIPRSAMFDAGRIIFQDLENLGTGYLQKRCYAYGTEIPIGNTERWNLGDFNVSSYIKGISILDQELEQTIVGNLDKFHNTDNEFIVRYNLKYIKLNYLEKVNGLPTTRKWCSKNVGECIERKGIVTKFEEEKNDETIYTKRFYPEVSLAGSYADQAREDYKPKLTDEKGVACNYKFNKIQIKDNKPNLVFRIIDTKNPFSGKTGNGRVIGSNWCEGGYACTSEGIEDYSELKLIQDNIINKPNSSGLNYDGTTATPKYTIDLNYNTMQSIREYNKKHNYNSFEQKCDETGECSSKFIKEYLK